MITLRKLMLLSLTLTILVSNFAVGEPAASNANERKAKKVKKCLFPNSRKRAPEWICNAQDEGEMVTATGSFHKSGAGNEHMEQMASADARANLARKLHVSGNQSFTDQQLEGSRVIKKIYGPKGTLYVLIGIDKAAAQKK